MFFFSCKEIINTIWPLTDFFSRELGQKSNIEIWSDFVGRTTKMWDDINNNINNNKNNNKIGNLEMKKKKKKYELYNNGELSSKSKVKRKKNDLEKKILFPTPEKKFHRNISRNNVQNEKGGRQNT